MNCNHNGTPNWAAHVGTRHDANTWWQLAQYARRLQRLVPKLNRCWVVRLQVLANRANVRFSHKLMRYKSFNLAQDSLVKCRGLLRSTDLGQSNVATLLDETNKERASSGTSARCKE